MRTPRHLDPSFSFISASHTIPTSDPGLAHLHMLVRYSVTKGVAKTAVLCRPFKFPVIKTDDTWMWGAPLSSACNEAVEDRGSQQKTIPNASTARPAIAIIPLFASVHFVLSSIS